MFSRTRNGGCERGKPKIFERNQLMKGESQDSCGCSLGAKFMAIALALSLVYDFVPHLHRTESTGDLILRTVVITFLAAGLGKIIGILHYKYKAKIQFHSKQQNSI
jgi:hypothetical protein